MANENNNDKKTTYTVDGEEVVLTRQIVRNYIARGNDEVSDADIVQFISLCRVNLLNPFVGDAYLVRYKGNNGKPANTQMIISKEAFMKRAEAAPNYEGFQAGIIIRRDGKIVEEEGAFFVPGDELVGGWARVYNGKKFPTVIRVRLQEYNKGQSTWAGMPATMIRKVAIAQAFREAFPLKMGGMYIPEEMPDVQSGEAPAALENAKKPAFIDAPAPEETKDPEAPEFTPDLDPVERQAEPDPALVKAGLVEKEDAQKQQDLFKL